jgi:hypothetical protein
LNATYLVLACDDDDDDINLLGDNTNIVKKNTAVRKLV